MRAQIPILAGALLVGAPAAAQVNGILVLKDGRTVEASQIKKEGEGYVLIYPHGEITVPADLVGQAYLLEGAAGDGSVGASAEDHAKLAKGLVPFEGKWVPRKAMEGLLEKRLKKRQEAIDELRKHSQWVNRYTETTKHFAFEFTLPKDVAQGYMDFFEEYWNVFAKRWKISQPARLGKLKVCMYSNQDDFLRIGNVPRGVLGYFRFVEPLELNFFHDRRDPAFTLAVLWHECNHYLMHLYVLEKTHNPGWLEEGLAEYFGGSTWDPVKKVMTPGLTQEGRLVNLQDAMDGNEFKKLDELLRKPRIDALEYAWSWALVHLLYTKKYEAGFNKFITRMAKDKTLKRETWPAGEDFRWVQPDAQIELLKSCIGVKELKDLEKEWYDYIKKMEVRTPRGYFRAAQECQRWDRPTRAGLYYKKALELDPKYLPAYEGYADLLLDENKPGEARDILQKALAADPVSPNLYLLLARVEAKSDKQKAERYCNLAMDLAPDDVDIRWSAQMILER